MLHKRQHHSLSEPLNSENDEQSGEEDESNKKKQVYQSQLPWYMAEVTAQAREVDRSQRATQETLAILQKDLNFAK